MLNTLQVRLKSSFAIFVYPATPRFHDQVPVFSRVSAICEYGVLGFYSEFSYRAAYHRYAFLLGFSLSFNSLFCLFIVVCYLHYFICHVWLTSAHGCTERRTTAGGLGLTSTVLFMSPSFILSSFKVTISLHICFVGHIKEIYSQKIMAFHCRQGIQEKNGSRKLHHWY